MPDMLKRFFSSLRWSDQARVIGVALLYAALGKLVLTFFSAPGNLSMVWPPAGLALAALVLGGRHFWPGVFFGAILGCLGAGFSLALAIPFALGNTLEALLGRWLLMRGGDFNLDMKRPRDFVRLVWVGALGALLSAVIGTTALIVSGQAPAQTSFVNFLQWWQSELLGVMLATPLILVWRRWPWRNGFDVERSAEAAFCLALAFLCGQIVFLGWFHEVFAPIAYVYWMFLFISWAAVRIGRHAVTLMLMMVAGQSLFGATQGVGFFAADIGRTSLGNFWFFMTLLSAVGYSLASLMSESRAVSKEVCREKQLSDDIINSLPGAFFMLDDQGRLARWNPRLKAAVGYADEELAGKPALELIRVEDRPLIAERIAVALSEGEAQAEACLLDRNGVETPYQFNGRRTLLEGKAYIVGMGEDISGRKQAETALRDSELKFRLLFENANANITIFDMHGVILMLNECNARMMGGKPEDFIGKSLHDLYPEKAEYFLARYAEILRAGEGAIYEDQFPLPEGMHWFSSHVAPVIDTYGQSVGIQVVAVDITERKRMEESLRQSEELWKFALEGAGDSVWDWDVAMGMVYQSPRWAEMMGYGPEAARNMPGWNELVHPDDRTHVAANQAALSEGRIVHSSIELRMRDRSGGWRWILSRGLVVSRDGEGRPLRVVGTNSDITGRRQMEESLRKSEELWKFALEGSGDAVWELDVPSWQSHYTARWQQMLGYSSDEVVGDLHDWASRIHPDDLPGVGESKAALLAGKVSTTSDEVRVRCKDGSWKWILARGMVVSCDENGRPLRVVGTCTDITPLKEHQQQLERIAHFDALTGLPNRVLLAYRLQQALAQSQRRGQSLAVAYLDLDGFKAVNDRHGHNIGDDLLVSIAQRMKLALREGDTLARIGGDEFIAVLADLDQPQDCEPVLDRLLLAAASPVTVGKRLLQVSASVGVTIYPGDGADAEQLIRHADQAMYQAKQAGKNRYHMFDVDRDAAVQLQHESIANIRRGLARGEFILLYQPKVNMKTGTLIGVEALIRWQHPERGLMPPSSFLPVIEEQMVSIELGEWVIDAALGQMEAWRAVGLELPVSVNIAAYHLQQDDFVERLADLLAAHPGVDPSDLELEILETGALDDVMQVSSVMRACQAFGMNFALDDFGTGYSSLTYLKRLPAAMLKIDQSFVRDMLDDPDDLAIVEGVVGLAQAFRRKVIAEGVETTAHGELLLQLGCELAQGYGIAAPMPAPQLFEWAANWHPDPSWAAWREGPTSHGHMALAFAEVRHRQWLRGIDQLLAGVEPVLPLGDIEPCQFGVWLDGQGSERYGVCNEFRRVTLVHERMHEVGRELISVHAAGRVEEARARQAELRALHDELTALLRLMMKSSAG